MTVKQCRMNNAAEDAVHGMCISSERTLVSVLSQILVTVRVLNWTLGTRILETRDKGAQESYIALAQRGEDWGLSDKCGFS